MKTYDNPLTISYNLGEHDFAAGNMALAIQRPKGVKSCRVEEMHVAVTEVFNGSVSKAFLRIGTASDADKFAELDMDLAANTDGWGTNDDTDAIKTAGQFIDLDRAGDAGVSLDQLEVTTLQNVDGGTETGIGHVTVVLSWF